MHDKLVVADHRGGVGVVGAQAILVVGMVVRDDAVCINQRAVQIVAVDAVVVAVDAGHLLNHVVREAHLVVVEIGHIVVKACYVVAVKDNGPVLGGCAAPVEVDGVAAVQNLVADEADVADGTSGGFVNDGVGVSGCGRFVALQDAVVEFDVIQSGTQLHTVGGHIGGIELDPAEDQSGAVVQGDNRA